jgi:ATP-dependent helicase/nuclease subunit A
MGIPAHAEVGGSLMGALEVRDVIAALQVLDNFQQDIPLAGVLRSGIFGDRFNEDELVEIRLVDRNAPFHSAVRLYGESGNDSALRGRLGTLLLRIRTYRDEVTRRPLAQTVWNLLERQGYMAYASGLPNGTQRRANLLKLYDLARRFSSSRRQGLHRFLRLLESLAGEDQSIAQPQPGAGDNVVPS